MTEPMKEPVTKPATQRILIAGCGDLGGRLGVRLEAEGHRVWGLRRSVEKLPPRLLPLAGDLTDPASLPELPEVDAVVYTAAADGFTDDAYRRAYVDGVRTLFEALPPESGPARWLHVGSTSVYAQSGGERVDETSPTEPEHFGGRRLLEGEALLAKTAAERDVRATVVRFGGIYGPGRTRLLDSVRRGTATCYEPQVWTNRIHIDDCVGALVHLLGHDAPEDLYLGVDCEPALDGDVKRWLARKLDLPDPPVSEPSANSRAMRSNKRCSNARLLASGYEFRYPDYRAGYGALLAESTP